MKVTAVFVALMIAGISSAINVIPASSFTVPKGTRLQKRELGHSGDMKDESGEPMFHIQDESLLSEDSLEVPGSSNKLEFEPSRPDGESPQGGPTLLRTKLAINRDASIFATYVRDLASIEDRLDTESSVSLILAPSDEAVSELSEKPWQFPTNVPKGDEKQADKAIRSNLKSFVESHIYLGTVGAEPGTFEIESANGLKISVTRAPDGNLSVTTKSAGIDISANVLSVTNAANGNIWVLDKSLVRP